jgi:hypothetical protein
MLNFSCFNAKSYKNVTSLLCTMKTCGLIRIKFNKYELFKFTYETLYLTLLLFFSIFQMPYTYMISCNINTHTFV